MDTNVHTVSPSPHLSTCAAVSAVGALLALFVINPLIGVTMGELAGAWSFLASLILVAIVTGALKE